MAMEALNIALTIVKTIYKLYDDKTTADGRIKEMIERVYSLDQPLQVLKKNCKNPTAYETALNRLVTVLKEVEHFLKGIQSTSLFNQAKRWALGEAQLNTMADLNGLLNNSLMDLQTAIQAEESERSEARVMETALATVSALAEAEKQKLLEQIRVCVHCGQEYRESANAEGSCKYHKTIPVGSWTYTMNCCGKQHKNYDACFTDPDGCVRGKHRDKHHTDFPYSNYFKWMRKESERESETLLVVSQEDLEDDYDKSASFGLRDDGSYFLNFKKGHMNLFLGIYSKEDLQKMTSESEMVMIASRGSDKLPGEFDVSTPEKKWFINAYWILQNSKIAGISFTTKSLSKQIPNSKTIYFKPEDLPKFTEIQVTYDDSQSKKDFQLPEFTAEPKVINYQPFPETIFQARKLKDDYPTETTGSFKLRIKQNSKVEGNPKNSGFSSDNFVVSLMLLHLGQSGTGSSPSERMAILEMVRDGKITVDEGVKLITACETTSHSEHPFNIIEMKTEYQYEDETEWRPTEFEPTLEEGKIPLELKPRGAEKIVLKAAVQATGKAGSWFNRAFSTRLKGIRIRVTFEEMGGGKASTIFEYANPPAHFTQREKDDIFFLSIDSIREWERYYIRVTKPENADYLKIQRISTYLEVKPKLLRIWAYQAKKTNSKEFVLSDFGNDNHQAYALVDLDYGVIYGFKFVLKVGEESTSDTFLLPTEFIQI